jgi:hypothetical protein
MKNFKEKNEKAYKAINNFLVVIVIGIAIIVSAIVYSIAKIPDQVTEYHPNEIMVLSDTTGTWEDEFDSTYVYNGCKHYTHKTK